ncbi:MAG: EamA family transporter [Bacteroidia bacterium]
MWYVAGSVLTNVLLLLWLRLLRLPLLSLITLNYVVCVGLAIVLAPPTSSQLATFPPEGWLVVGILGLLFISVFLLTGQATQRLGVGLTGMLAKLSVVIPIGLTALVLGERLTTPQKVGLLLGLGAIIALHAPYLQDGRWRALLGALPIGLLVWLGNGIIDTLFKLSQPYWQRLSTLHVPLLIMIVAGVVGLLIHFLQKRLAFLLQPRLWAGALLLGGTNLLSIVFYLQGLKALPAAQFFLWNNLGIVLLSGLVGLLAFRERFTPAVGLGYVLGAAALVLVR